MTKHSLRGNNRTEKTNWQRCRYSSKGSESLFLASPCINRGTTSTFAALTQAVCLDAAAAYRAFVSSFGG